MKLSEDRIDAIAYKIAFELVKKRYLKSQEPLRQVTTWVEKPMLDDLQTEERIEDEVRRILRSQSSCPPEGSFAYQALYQRKKEEVARRFNYEL